MKPFLTKLYTNKLFPLSWTLFTIFLLCLPGSALPGAGIFVFKGLDKVIHFILFGGIVLVWGLYIRRAYPPAQHVKMTFLAILFSIALGIALEYVQLYFITGRSFDVNDIAADAGGAIIVFIVLTVIRRREEEG
ncbi:MAG TPA: VanZ family protein [Chitinophaga sp.]|nr:VanZ family protein [Chitinophaga sp.]